MHAAPTPSSVRDAAAGWRRYATRQSLCAAFAAVFLSSELCYLSGVCVSPRWMLSGGARRALSPRAAFARAMGDRDPSCMVAPASWGPPARFSQATGEGFSRTPPLFVYSSVLVAGDPVCARITTTRAPGDPTGAQRWGAPAPTPAPEATELDALLPAADGENDRIVFATHTSVDNKRLNAVVRLERLWRGCMSVAVWVCDEAEFAMVAGLHGDDAGLHAHATIHVVVGWAGHNSTTYPVVAPYPNAMRNVPMQPFAPWPPAAPRALQPRPWVLVADADAMPSTGEAVLRRWVSAALAGRLAVPPSHMDPIPGIGPRIAGSSHAWFRIQWPEQLAAPLPRCDAWDGAPEPFACDASPAAPNGRDWAQQAGVLDRADAVSRCGRQLDAERTMFVVPSFDIDHEDCREDPDRLPGDMRLKAGPTSMPSRALAFIMEHLGTRRITFQAWAYPPAYGGMMPWSSWLRQPATAGVLPLHYSFLHEPYFLIKAPLPAALPGRDVFVPGFAGAASYYELFDEGYRSMWFDKAALHADLAAGPGAFALHVMPHAFLLNAHCGESASRPKTPEDFKRKDAAFQRLLAATAARGLSCTRDTCPCNVTAAYKGWGGLGGGA